MRLIIQKDAIIKAKLIEVIKKK